MHTIRAVVGSLILVVPAGLCWSEDTVTGTVTLKGQKATFSHAYGRWDTKEMGMVRVLLSDTPLPADILSDLPKRMEFAGRKKIALLDFVVWPGGSTKIMNVVLFHPALPSLDQVPSHEPGHAFQIKSFEKGRLSASFKSDGERKTMSAGAPLSYDVTFDVTAR